MFENWLNHPCLTKEDLGLPYLSASFTITHFSDQSCAREEAETPGKSNFTPDLLQSRHYHSRKDTEAWGLPACVFECVIFKAKQVNPYLNCIFTSRQRTKSKHN